MISRYASKISIIIFFGFWRLILLEPRCRRATNKKVFTTSRTNYRFDNNEFWIICTTRQLARALQRIITRYVKPSFVVFLSGLNFKARFYRFSYSSTTSPRFEGKCCQDNLEWASKSRHLSPLAWGMDVVVRPRETLSGVKSSIPGFPKSEAFSPPSWTET